MDFVVEEKNKRWWQLGIIIWMVSAIFSHLFRFPVIYYKFQIFECFFLLYFWKIFQYIPQLLKQNFHLRTPILAYILLIVINLLTHFNKTTFADNVGSLYACLISLVFGFSLFIFKPAKVTLEKGFIFISLSLVLTTILGYLISAFGLSNAYVYAYENYPYVGDINRFKGFLGGPNDVVYVGGICLFYLFFALDKISKKLFYGLFISLTFILFFTYAKEIVLILGAIVATFLVNNTRWKIWSWAFSLAFTLFIVFFTFFYFTSSDQPDFRKDIIKDEVLMEYGGIKIYGTSYFFIFKSAVNMMKKQPVIGVGFGNFRKEMTIQQEQGSYPKEFYIYKAHDNYQGLVAQYGIGYLAVLFLFARDIRRMMLANFSEKKFIQASTFFILFCGFIHYTYHFRFMWMVFGIFIYYSLLNSSSFEIIGNKKHEK